MIEHKNSRVSPYSKHFRYEKYRICRLLNWCHKMGFRSKMAVSCKKPMFCFICSTFNVQNMAFKHRNSFSPYSNYLRNLKNPIGKPLNGYKK